VTRALAWHLVRFTANALAEAVEARADAEEIAFRQRVAVSALVRWTAVCQAEAFQSHHSHAGGEQ